MKAELSQWGLAGSEGCASFPLEVRPARDDETLLTSRPQAGPLPIVLTVRVAGQEIGRFEHLDGQGWRSFQFPLGAFAGRTEDVEFEVSSSNHRERYFCFQADSR